MRKAPGFFALLCSLFAASASAQSARITAPPLLPGVSIAAPDEAYAVEINPAALAYLDSWELAYLHTQTFGDRGFAEQGDSLYFGTPLIFGFAFGLAAHSIRPGEDAFSGTTQANRGMATLSLARQLSSSFALGASFRYLGSSDPILDGITSLDLSASWRVSPYIAIAAIGHDLTGPLDLSGIGGGQRLPATFVLSAALRPTGTNAFTFDLASSIDTEGNSINRLAVDVAVPYVGRALIAGEMRASDEFGSREYLATAGLDIDFGNYGVSGGAVVNDGSDDVGFYAGARMSGAARPGIPAGRYVREIDVSGIDERGMMTLVVELDRAITDERVVGVFLKLGSTGIGLAYAQELRWMIAALRRAGKPVACYVENATGSDFYACANANAIFADPAGGVRLMGPSTTALSLADLLRRIGLRADFIRIGRFKSAPEQFANRHPSPSAREMHDAMLDSIYGRLTSDLSTDLGVSPAEVRAVIDRGPFVTPEAIEEGLIEAEVDMTEIDEHLEGVFGDSFPRYPSAPLERTDRFGDAGRIGVVLLDGDIVDGDNVDIPFVGVHMSGGHTIAESIDAMAADDTVRAIVLRIDSPGGSVLASDQIWRAAMRARRYKPVIASMGAIAASGGYYAAAGATEIWADPSTLTGSIGVFYGKVDVEGLAEMIGVGLETNERGRHAGAESLYQPLTADERALLADKVRFWYRRFLARIADGRDADVVATHRVAQGRVWTGDAALRHGLVDRLGGFGAALSRARAMTGLSSESEVIVLPARPGGLLDYVLGGGASADVLGGGASADGGAGAVTAFFEALPPELRAALRSAIAFSHVRDGAPMARMEDLIVVQ